MALILRLNILAELKNCGYSTYRIRDEKLLSQATVQKLRNFSLPSWKELDRICELLEAQPGDLVGYIPNEQRDEILGRINDRKDYIEEYAEEEEWGEIAEDYDYPIQEKIYEDLGDYIYVLEEENPEIAVVVKDINDHYDFLHNDLTEKDWSRLKRKYKAAPTNKARQLIEYCTGIYRKAFEETYSTFIKEYTRTALEKEAAELIGDIDYYTNYEEL